MSPTQVVFSASGMWLPWSGQPAGSTPNVAPGPPTNVRVTAATSSTLTVAWDPATDTDGTIAAYELRRGGSLAGSTTGTTFAVTGLAASTAYTLAVRAVDDRGASSVDVSVVAATSADVTALSHGREVTLANTGPFAYLDPVLGRPLTLSDLIVHNSPVYASELADAGGLISKRWFKGGLILDLLGVTVRGALDAVGFRVLPGMLAAFEYCAVDTQGSVGSEAVRYNGYTMLRCQLTGCSDGAKTNGSNTRISETWIRTAATPSGDHNDGCQNNAGVGPVTIERSNIDARPVNGGGGPNGALFCSDGATGLQTWSDNLLAGGAYTMILHDAATYDVQGNDVVEGTYVYGPASRAVIPSTDVTWGTVRPNRIVTPTGAVVSTIPAP